VEAGDIIKPGRPLETDGIVGGSSHKSRS